MTHSCRLMNVIKLGSAERKLCNESLPAIYFPYRSVVSFGETTRSIGVEGKTQVIMTFSSFIISTSLPVFHAQANQFEIKRSCTTVPMYCAHGPIVLLGIICSLKLSCLYI